MFHCLNLQIGEELAMNSTDGGTGLKLSLACNLFLGIWEMSYDDI